MTDAPLVGIVTPEAVLLDLPAAGIATRMAAKAIDLALQGGVLLLGASIGGLVLGGSSASVTVFLVIWAFVVVLLAPVLSEGLWNGRTPGKAVLRLRAVTLDGGPLQWRHAFLRGLAQVVDVFLLLGIIPAMATRRSQRFGDLMAGTFVLVEPATTLAARPIAFYPPPGWEAYVASLDVGRLRPDQYRLIRSFLLRVGELEAGARWHLSARLADAALARVSPPPGPTAPPETFLIAVASAYQHRNGGLPPRP
jgi:uncharacterized RDD family membrane protein YckC